MAVVDTAGRPVMVTELANTEAGFHALEQLLAKRAATRVGIEGSGNYGRGAAVHLAPIGGLEVVEVPPSLTSRERSGRPGAGKTAPEPALPPVRLAVGQAADLRALADYRAQLVAECTALANRTHTELHGLRPGYQVEVPRLTAPTFITAAQGLLDGDSSVRAQPTRRRLTRRAQLTAEVQEVTALITAAVAEVETGLTDLYGVGPVGAATILGEVADIRRYRSRHAFAAASPGGQDEGDALEDVPVRPAGPAGATVHRWRPGGISGSTSAQSSSPISRGGGEDAGDDMRCTLRRPFRPGQSPKTYFRNHFLLV